MMMIETLATPRSWRPRTDARPRFTAAVIPVETMLAEIAHAAELRAGTTFQSTRWLDAWYTAFRADAAIQPLAVAVQVDGRPALLLPLAMTQAAGLRTIQFADLGVTDYNAPVLGPAAPDDRAGAIALWRVVRRCLPSADLVQFTKMPAEIAGRANPLALLPGVTPAPVFGNLVEVGDDYRAWQRTVLKADVRKELERAQRQFERHPGAAFLRVRDPATAHRVYEALRVMQRRRAAEAGFAYRLDEPAYDAVYRRALEQGLEDGSAVLTALVVGEEVVAASFALADGRSFTGLRIGDAGGEWRKRMSARLLIHRTMEHLHGEGCRLFDFALGDHSYKRRFGARARPLLELTQALSLHGVPRLGLDRARGFVRARPGLASLARRLLRMDGSGAGDSPQAVEAAAILASDRTPAACISQDQRQQAHHGRLHPTNAGPGWNHEQR
jgi:CelD/BcsL family acetyltransferase involved in cellulose biosynthesis